MQASKGAFMRGCKLALKPLRKQASKSKQACNAQYRHN